MAPPCGSERRWSRAVKMTFYCLFFLIPMSSAGNRNINTIFGKKQKLEVQQQLKRLNKPALKSIESPDGDIIDCVDIYKQPAFDHPLLKNHTIQMRPSSYPEGFSFDEINDVSSNFEPEFTQPWHLNGRCPEGTIPIRRTKEEDLLRAGSVANFGRKKYHTNPHTQSNINLDIHEYATYSETWDKYYGMTADMNLWNPYTQEENEFSNSQLWVVKGEYGQDLDTIEVGAMVYEAIFGDKNTRLFVYWTDDAYQSTGCYNLLCPGFVHVDKEIALGATVTPYSKYGGNQYALKFYIWKDVNGRGNWWMNINNRVFGYWPSSLFSILSDSASTVRWGGEIINYNSGGQHTTTQMGSGHFAEEGPDKASFFKNLNVIDGKQIQRAPRDPEISMTKPNCYTIKDYGGFFYLGGPGRNPNCP
ncbi:uncharacterized protein LOC115984845 [Quercus lobata]|uniref:uncharacterized protein LOC115984845 n=1 Tax=Quercus lobata TaxID=97700 RepID=UPI001246E879|nr:uncharacterized protein LOC115984845 [Quercus lobata]